MNCELCKKELDAYREGRLPEGIRVQVKVHLESCEECTAIYEMESFASMVVNEEKAVSVEPVPGHPYHGRN